MQTQTFYRKANVPSAEAIASINRSFPKAKLVDFEKKVAEDQGEAAAARAKVGDEIYVASIRTAEFPPVEEEESESSEPEEAEESDSDSDPAESSESDDEGSDSGAAPPAFGGEDSGEGEKPKKLSPEEETNHLLRQILDAIQGGGDLGGLGGPEDMPLPDIGAPEDGPGGALGPPGPAGAKPPLPPPIKQKSPVGGPSFSSFNANADVQVAIREVDDNLSVASIKKEAEEFWPTHKVAKIQWIGSRADKKAKVILVKR